MLLCDNRLPDRIWRRIEVAESGCWNWLGYISATGYGNVHFDGRDLRIHRVVYEALVGPIPTDLVIDHLCRNRGCCNPQHLEAVTFTENVRRGAPAQKTRCVNGHPYDEKNTYRRPNGQRDCRACIRARQRACQARKLAA